MSLWRPNETFSVDQKVPQTLGQTLRASLSAQPESAYPTKEALQAMPDQRASNLPGFVSGAGTALTFVSKRLGLASLTGLLVSGQGMELASYNDRFNVSEESRLLVQKGYALLLTPPMIAQLNGFLKNGFVHRGGSYPFVGPKPIMTGSEISLTATNMDALISPDGPLSRWLSKLVGREFINRSDYSKSFDSRSTKTKANGGMRGGYNNHYHGITQFSVSTYQWVRDFGRSVGVEFPTSREELSFAGQLVAAYVLGVLNQGIIRPYIKGPITADQLYIAHNQGAGVFKTRRITVKRFWAQSSTVRELLLKEGFNVV